MIGSGSTSVGEWWGWYRAGGGGHLWLGEWYRWGRGDWSHWGGGETEAQWEERKGRTFVLYSLDQNGRFVSVLGSKHHGSKHQH